MSAETWTLGRLLEWTTKYFQEKSTDFPRLDAEVLLAHALGCPRIMLYTRYEEPAADELRNKFKGLVRQRVEGCPVAYLVGRKEFFSLEFAVNPAVLIPRPDTEILVMEAVQRAKAAAAPAVLDVGTGSGAIAVAVAKNVPAAQVTATDISREALEVARQNAAKHGVAERIRLLHGDLLAPVPQADTFDLILSNPPYIPTDALPLLPPGVRDYEPKLALDGGSGGYQAIDRLLDQARARLTPGGSVLVEIGAAQEAAVRQLFQKYGYTDVATVQDYAGHPRVLRAKRVQ